MTHALAGDVLPGTGDRPREGEALLLLHSLALDRTIWDQHVDRLRELSTVVRVDLPGHGKSHPVTEITVDAMADEVAEYVANAGFDRLTVIGLSLGGCVAQSLAIRHPQLVSSLGLFDTTAWYGPEGLRRWTRRAERARSGGLKSLSDFQLERWFTALFREKHVALYRRLLDIFVANDLDSYVAVCHALGTYNGLDDLARIVVPTRVVVGELDYATPVADALELARRIPDATLRIAAGCNHLSPLERPDVFFEVAADLLAVSARPGSTIGR
jgi:3-oxoadipate enol-lactonase